MNTPRITLWSLIAGLSVLSLWSISTLKYDFEIDNLFPTQNDAVTFYRNEVLPFEGTKQYEVVGIQLDSNVFKGSALLRISKLTQALGSVEGVVTATSLSNIRYQRIRPFSDNIDFPFFYPKEKNRYTRDSSFFVRYRDVREKFLSQDGKAICIFLELDSLADDRNVLSQIPKIVQLHGFSTFFLNGSLQTNNTFTEALKHDLFNLSMISLTLIILILAFIFRSVWGILFPMIIICLSVCWTMGIVALLGFSLNTLTVMIPSLVAIVGMSDVIHVLSRYKEEQQTPTKFRLQRTFGDIGQAIFFTSVTTALGFLTLVLADIQPIIEFGVGTAAGVMIAYGLARWVLPDLLKMRPEFLNQEVGICDKTIFFKSITKKPKTIIVLAIGFLALGLAGMTQLKVDSLLYDEIAGNDEYSSSLRFFDRQFAGIRSVDLHIEAHNHRIDFFALENLKKLDSLETYLEQDYKLKSHYSLVTQVKRMHRSLKGGHPRFFRLPESEKDLKPIVAYVRSHSESLGLYQLIGNDDRSILVRGRISDEGSYVTSQKNRELAVFLNEIFSEKTGFRWRISGRSALLDLSNELISRQLGWGLLGAMILVAICIGLLLRSFKMVLIALIVNALPLVMVAGLMGFGGIGLNMSSAVIFTIAFGIAVDDTIHFLSRFRSELRKGTPKGEAISNTFYSTGRAIVLTSVVLILGFGVLVFSNFQATRTTGLLISTALLMAVFADVLLLPVLLRIFYQN